MFLPVKPDFRLQRFPLLTTLVCLICISVFAGQQIDWYEYDEATDRYCDMSRSRLQQMVFGQIEANHQLEYCDDIAYILHYAEDEDEMIGQLISGMRPLTGFDAKESNDYVSQMLRDELATYRRVVPPDPDEGLAYYSETWNPWNMITSSFAHGGWGHIFFNLIFFIAFGMMVEMLVGRFTYVSLIITISLITGVFTSVSAMANGEEVASLGLSGVVMGMIGVSAFLLPRGRIRCYYWFIILFGSVALPIWGLAIWYIGGDIYALFAYDDHGVINVMAHVTGGIGGYLFGVLFLRNARLDAQGVQMTIDRAELRPRFF
jgi:membrane associated rhomboid family serine protease